MSYCLYAYNTSAYTTPSKFGTRIQVDLINLTPNGPTNRDKIFSISENVRGQVLAGNPFTNHHDIQWSIYRINPATVESTIIASEILQPGQVGKTSTVDLRPGVYQLTVDCLFHAPIQCHNAIVQLTITPWYPVTLM